MASPFPGMDPYLEHPEICEDFHANLAGEIQAQLNPSLVPKYVAVLVPRVSYEEVIIGETYRAVKPDVSVLQVDDKPFGGTAVAIAPPPLSVAVAEEVPVRLFTVEIKGVETDALVTAIEILSPVNKRRGHEAFTAYQRKLRDLHRGEVHLLEIDLLRKGERFPLPVTLPDAPYFIFLHRAGETHVDIWPLELAEPIPVVPVPLLHPDPDVGLDVGLAIKNVYGRAYYQLRIDYNKPPRPALSSKDADWIEKHFRDVRLG